MKGAYTALITPFLENGSLDIDGLKKLINFQIKNGIDGLLSTGTTGESPVLIWEEHDKITEIFGEEIRGRTFFISGSGSNNTKEAFLATSFAIKCKADAILLVDPYYNGPSSLEIRKEYIEPIAKKYKETTIIPYIIPGRTGTKLLPEDIGIIYDKYKNVSAVKEASGNFDEMRKTRKFCGKKFSILSGDDPIITKMMTDKDLLCSGTISVTSNIAPNAVAKMVKAANDKDFTKMNRLEEALRPLFNIVTVVTKEKTKFGEVECRARNPLAIKTVMQLLGMPSGNCRQPLGKMTKKGFEKVLSALKEVNLKNPELFFPIEEFFNVKIKKRLEQNWDSLTY